MLRSIPACAGEPACSLAAFCRRRVYPRVCGGTVCRAVAVHGGHGLSPRVRGNPRFIPRLRGGAGLSPRVRGNPPLCWFGGVPNRSIPACAGEPTSLSCREYRATVYPRVCGGTSSARIPSFPTAGLSPRVRGNPAAPPAARRYSRSIPACAGEPPAYSSPCQWRSVYPRVCGGTRSSR